MTTADRPRSSSYDALIRDHQPKHYYQHLDTDAGRWIDVIRGQDGVFPAGYGSQLLPNGEVAPHFDGLGQYAEMGDSSYFGPAGAASYWTVECWVRFDTDHFPRSQTGDLYVHWMGKGEHGGRNDGDHEWVTRVYNGDTGSVDRDKWVSGYTVSWHGHENEPTLACGQAYTGGWQVGAWHHLVYITDHINRRVGIWWDGQQAHGWVSMDAPKYDIEARNGIAPLRVGTRDFKSFLLGSVAKLAFYTYGLSEQRIREHYEAAPMHPGACEDGELEQPPLYTQ